MTGHYTVFAWLTLFVLAGGYELTAILKQWPTLSETAWKYSKLYPFIPFASGVLAGHLFASC